MLHTQRAMNTASTFLRLLDDPAPADFVLLATTDADLLNWTARDARYTLLDSDQHFALLDKDHLRYPVATSLLAAPECATEDWMPAIAAELSAWRNRERNLPVTLQRQRGMPLIASLLTAAHRYLDHDKALPLDQLLAPHVQIHSIVARALARMALARSDPSAALTTLAMVDDSERIPEDALLAALAQHQMGQFGAMRQNLLHFLEHGDDPTAEASVRDALNASEHPDDQQRFIKQALVWQSDSTGSCPKRDFPSPLLVSSMGLAPRAQRQIDSPRSVRAATYLSADAASLIARRIRM